MRLYVAVARGSFRRYATYLGATVAGTFANTVFGLVLCFVYTAVWRANPEAGGYDVADALTYVWIGQGLIMVVAIWGGGSPDDLAARIRSGDVAIDFYRPVSILAWYLAADLGRAAYHLLSRGVVPFVLGALLFDLHRPSPSGAALFLLALPLAVVVSFALRLLAALSAFWLLDDTGPRSLLGFVALFFSGLTLPLVLFPDGLRHVALVLPWQSFVQLPADLFLSKRTGLDAVAGFGLAAAWAAVLLLACAAVLRRAERRVVVQGG
ncbi:ABC transporter permease [Nocardioides rubriscoriae]|uniref:ABC transporter permease n=1 Tax=Nocardioides rubriscoriae TaxID=642762 RepID=UPI0011DF38DD|nr:ABC-2 family transporter protein [Nocardioides rubriscoriae]